MTLLPMARFKQVARALAERDTLSASELETMESHGANMLAATEAAVEAKL